MPPFVEFLRPTTPLVFTPEPYDTPSFQTIIIDAPSPLIVCDCNADQKFSISSTELRYQEDTKCLLEPLHSIWKYRRGLTSFMPSYGVSGGSRNSVRGGPKGELR